MVTRAEAADPLDRASGENFPVALRVLPRRHRNHLRAVYAFCRLVDDLADEPGLSGPRTHAEIAEALQAVTADLDRVFGSHQPRCGALVDLPATVGRCALPRRPFDALIEANHRDQVLTDYPTRTELLRYCALSANPVGELVLRVFGVPVTPQRRALSDDICTALQLIEHWQDVGQDAHRGRIYLPQVDRERSGVLPGDLLGDHAPPRLRQLLAAEAGWARDLLRRGSRLVSTLSGWPRLAVTGYVAGGAAALAALQQQGWDPLGGPAPSRRLDLMPTAIAVLVKGHLP